MFFSHQLKYCKKLVNLLQTGGQRQLERGKAIQRCTQSWWCAIQLPISLCSVRGPRSTTQTQGGVFRECYAEKRGSRFCLPRPGTKLVLMIFHSFMTSESSLARPLIYLLDLSILFASTLTWFVNLPVMTVWLGLSWTRKVWVRNKLKVSTLTRNQCYRVW